MELVDPVNHYVTSLLHLKLDFCLISVNQVRSFQNDHCQTAGVC